MFYAVYKPIESLFLLWLLLRFSHFLLLLPGWLMYTGVFSFTCILLEMHWTSRISESASYASLWLFQSLPLLPLLLFCPVFSPIVWDSHSLLLEVLILSHRSLRICWFVSSILLFFPICALNWVVSIDLPSNLMTLFSVISVLLLSPSSACLFYFR